MIVYVTPSLSLYVYVIIIVQTTIKYSKYPSLDEYFALGLNRVLSQIHPLGHHTGMLKVYEPCLS